MLVNGESADVLPINDRGLLYGDGVFETVAVRFGRPLHWDIHITRLQKGCQRLGIVPPAQGLLTREASICCGSADRAVLKVIVTRGVGARGYRTDDTMGPTRIMSLHM